MSDDRSRLVALRKQLDFAHSDLEKMIGSSDPIAKAASLGSAVCTLHECLEMLYSILSEDVRERDPPLPPRKRPYSYLPARKCDRSL